MEEVGVGAGVEGGPVGLGPWALMGRLHCCLFCGVRGSLSGGGRNSVDFKPSFAEIDAILKIQARPQKEMGFEFKNVDWAPKGNEILKIFTDLDVLFRLGVPFWDALEFLKRRPRFLRKFQF